MQENGHGCVPIKLFLQFVGQIAGYVLPTDRADSCFRASLINEPVFATTTTMRKNCCFFSSKSHIPHSPQVDRLIERLASPKCSPHLKGPLISGYRLSAANLSKLLKLNFALAFKRVDAASRELCPSFLEVDLTCPHLNPAPGKYASHANAAKRTTA